MLANLLLAPARPKALSGEKTALLVLRWPPTHPTERSEAMDLSDRFETTDGSSPEPTPLSEAIGKTHPLPAFALLREGDVFEAPAGKPPPEGPTRARQWVDSQVELLSHGASAAHRDRVKKDLVRQLSGNPALAGRLLA